MIHRPWRIELLGAFSACQGDNLITRFRTRKTASLLAYLAFHIDRAHARDELADLLWPDDEPESSRASLRTALNSLRKQLEPPGVQPGSVLFGDRAAVRLNPVSLRTDVAEFLEAMQQSTRASSDEEIELLERAVELHRGELLPGFYDEWVLTERTRLAAIYASLLKRLTARLVEVGYLDRALGHALASVAADPLVEESHTELMRIYRALGRPADVARQYQTLVRILDENLGERPSSESQAVANIPAAPKRMRKTGPPMARRGLPSHETRRREPVRPAPTLPVPLSAFFGRENEIDRLVELLARSAAAPERGARLITLVGPGGIGKTRLTVEVARRVERAFGGRVWFVSLAGLTAASAVSESISHVLKKEGSRDQDWLRVVRHSVEGRPGLLILDNFEHLVEDGAEHIEKLLASVPSLTCLLTSRSRLNIAGERIFPLSPLPLPGRSIDSPAGLLEFSCLRLFVDRAQSARPDFQLLPANAATIAELCRRLEGVPLALELAASWAHVLTPTQMLERTQDQLAIEGRRRASDGHESLRVAIDWSYRLLSPGVQETFRRLSVFRGGFDLSAAKAVCLRSETYPDEQKLISQLATLVESSLIVTQEMTLQAGPVMRYLMLESLRQYGAKAMSAQETQRSRERHAEYFLSSAEAYNAEVIPIPRDRLDPDIDNLRTALQWCAETPGRGRQALRFALGMFHLWNWWGHNREALTWTEQLLVHAEPGSAMLADGYCSVGNLYYGLNDAEKSVEYQQRHLEIRRQLGDDLGIAKAQCNIGASLTMMGCHSEARGWLLDSLDGLQRLRAAKYVPSVQLDLADNFEALGEHQEAERLYWSALRSFQDQGAGRAVANCYARLAAQALRGGRREAARDLYATALRLDTEAGVPNLDDRVADLASVLDLMGEHRAARSIRKSGIPQAVL